MRNGVRNDEICDTDPKLFLSTPYVVTFLFVG